jgi:triphosphoribosyl-dephospho-CoA synthase
MNAVWRAGREAFLGACECDVAVRKPGNVSDASAGHRMQAAMFRASAAAAVDPLFEPGRRVGERIEAAVAATQAAVGCNTNLGILLLAAPLAAALEHAPSALGDAAALRTALGEVLDDLDVDDAAAAFRAIAAANPGGLGSVEQQDVQARPTVTLREAMALAAPRDSIARQYRDGFADLFDHGLPMLRQAVAAAHGRPRDAMAVQGLYLGLLARRPDSHIVRKRGEPLAQTVMESAQDWHRRWLTRQARGERLDDDPAFAAWDEALKADGVNPGTTADLTVTTLMLGALTGL